MKKLFNLKRKNFFCNSTNSLKNFFILTIFIFNIQPCFSEPHKLNKEETRSIIVGHLYPIMEHNIEILENLFYKIKLLNPDFIFVLGDSKLNDLNVIKKWQSNFGNKVYFSPGNHEIENGNLDKYNEVVGYTEKVIETPNTLFLVGNSNSNAKNLTKFIESNIKPKNTSSKSRILLIHHRIWDDTLTSAKPYQHDKSYYLKDIYPTLQKGIDIIFAGNSKNQYFYDFYSSNGNQNMNNIFWVDRIGDISAYSIGTGIGRPKLGFIELISNKDYPAIVIPHHINTQPDLIDPIPIESQVKIYGSKIPEGETVALSFFDNQIMSLKYNLRKYLGRWKRPFTFLFFYLSGIFTIIILKKIRIIK